VSVIDSDPHQTQNKQFSEMSAMDLQQDKTLVENAIYWARKNGHIERVTSLLNNISASKEDILDYCNPRPRGKGNPCFKHKSVRQLENNETRLFDAIGDYDGVFIKLASDEEKHRMYKHLNTLNELFDFQAYLQEINFSNEFKLETLQEEFSRAVAWYLGRIDVKNAEAISLHIAMILAEAPLTKEGFEKCAIDLAFELGDIRFHIVEAMTSRLKKYF
jgi:hypothetical protein